jgi:ferric-dicitrate binding protein FerR (iron transport regulator)
LKDFDTLSESELAAERLRRHLLDVDESPASVAARRRRFITAAMAPERRPLRFVPVAAVVGLTTIACAIWLHRSVPALKETPLTFTAGEERSRGDLGVYFASASGSTLPLNFSDGSVMVLQDAARARVTATTSAGASVLLEAGRVKVDVVHQPRTEWTIASGPYSVRVTGTSFLMGWEPGTGTFEITMVSGTVVVRGPGIDSGVSVGGSQRFVTSLAPKIEPIPAPTATAAEVVLPSPIASESFGANHPDQVGTPEAPRVHDRATEMPSPRSVANQSASVPEEDWTALAARGQHRRVVEAADGKGIETVLSSASENDLSALADAARYTGRTDLARRALLSIRSRFPGAHRAKAAAFLLGRMMDDANSPTDAVAWYDKYLAESPDGTFAAEALGRRMVALRRSGDLEATRRAARDYLKRFPAGPYAGVAGEIAEP